MLLSAISLFGNSFFSFLKVYYFYDFGFPREGVSVSFIHFVSIEVVEVRASGMLCKFFK